MRARASASRVGRRLFFSFKGRPEVSAGRAYGLSGFSAATSFFDGAATSGTTAIIVDRYCQNS